MPYIFHKNTKEILLKICGLSHLSDIQKCAELGVDAVGFLLGDPKGNPGSDKLPLEDAESLISAAPAGLATVVLIKESDFQRICSIIRELSPSSIQLQLKEISPETVERLKREFPGKEFIKTIYISDEDSPEQILNVTKQYLNCADAILLDSARGGSGKTHNWEKSRKIRDFVKKESGKPIILAGGLNTGNIEDAIKAVQPDAIDIMSSVRMEGNRKDSAKISEILSIIGSMSQ